MIGWFILGAANVERHVAAGRRLGDRVVGTISHVDLATTVSLALLQAELDTSDPQPSDGHTVPTASPPRR